MHKDGVDRKVRFTHARTYGHTYVLTGACAALTATGTTVGTTSFSFLVFFLASFLSFSLSLSDAGAAPYSFPLFSLYSSLRDTKVSTSDLIASLSPYSFYCHC